MPKHKSLTGFEAELFTLDSSGFPIDGADALLEQAKKGGKHAVKKEVARNMVEIATSPNLMVAHSMNHLLTEMDYLIDTAAKNNMVLCPLGTYPGNFAPFMRDDKIYKIKESILGKNRFSITGRVCGFHCHYTLPKGIFDDQLRILKVLAHQKIKDSLVNSYNFLIAADPAMTCFMQSSPFYQGKFIGKDSRLIMYRGGKHLDSPSGAYSNFPEFGGLPHYMLTVFDIENIISANFENWKSYIMSLGMNIKVLSMYGSILDTTWAPIKINPNGTLEQRGMDMNHPTYLTGMGVLMKFILKSLQDESYAVIPSDIAIKEPFKIEKDVLYIPPYTYVRNELQKLSAYKGMEDDAVYDYCKRLLKLGESVVPKDRQKLLAPLKKMLKERKTVSDEIIEFAKKRGWKKDTELTKSLASEIAISHSIRLEKEIDETRKMIKSLL